MTGPTLQELLERLSSVVSDAAVVATELGGDWGRQLTEVVGQLYDAETELTRYVRQLTEAFEDDQQ